MRKYTGTLSLLCLAVVLILMSCENVTPTAVRQLPTARPPTTQPRVPTDTPIPAGSADLTISNVSIVRIDPQQGSPYYQFEGVVRNTGNADATGFEAGCTYSCSGGTVLSGGFSLVQGGYIGANSSSTLRSVNRISCNPMPAFLTNVTCDVDSNNDVDESRENNNTFNPGQLAVPF